MQIELGSGLDLIQFGMSVESTVSVLGEPDEEAVQRDGEWPCRELAYDNAGVVCSYALETGRLEMIMLTGGHELFGRDLYGKPFREVVAFLREHIAEEPVVGAESVNDRAWTSVEYPDTGLSLTFERDVLTLLIIVE